MMVSSPNGAPVDGQAGTGRVDHDGARLVRLDSELSGLLRKDPARLLSTEAPLARDGLVLCGLIGGKDVGKSALINALCEREVSSDRAQVGEGTFGAVAYVHRADEAALDLRFRAVWGSGESRRRGVESVFAHDGDAARGLVLIDLPDLSSTFDDHLRVVQSILPALDRIVWVWDPVLAGDRSYAERVGRVVKDPSNVSFVLNKADLLLRDGIEKGVRSAAVWDEWMSWFRAAVSSSVRGADGGDVASPADRWFMVSAAYPDARAFLDAAVRSWGDDVTAGLRDVGEAVGARSAADLVRLRGALLQGLNVEQVQRIKSGNDAAQVSSDREEMARHFELDRVVALVDGAGIVVGEEVEAAFGGEFVDAVSRRLARRGASDAELGERVLAARLDHWPLLPAIYWLGRGVVRFVGRRMSGETASGGGRHGEMWRIDGIPLDLRVDGMLARIRARLGELVGVLREAPPMPASTDLSDRLEGALAEIVDELDDAVVADCIAHRKPPGLLRRSAVWFILLWFVALQPIGEGLLRLISAADVSWSDGILAGLREVIGTGFEMGVIVFSVLSADSLLRGVVVVLLLYVIWLALMYARAIRDVRRARGVETLAEGEEASGVYAARVMGVVESRVVRPVSSPLNELTDRAGAWRRIIDES